MNRPPGRATDQEGSVRGDGAGEGVGETGAAGEDAAGVKERRASRPYLLTGVFRGNYSHNMFLTYGTIYQYNNNMFLTYGTIYHYNNNMFLTYGTIYHAIYKHVIHYTSSKDSLKRFYSK